MRLLSRRSWDAAKEHRQVCAELGDAHTEAESVYWNALIVSQTDHETRRVAHHEAVAKQAALVPAAKVHALTLMERSLRVELGILEKLVSALQSALKNLRVDG